MAHFIPAWIYFTVIGFILTSLYQDNRYGLTYDYYNIFLSKGQELVIYKCCKSACMSSQQEIIDCYLSFIALHNL